MARQANIFETTSIQPLRDYQARAIHEVRETWSRARSVCLVSPTGSGKTRMGEEIVADEPGRTLWIAHRRELIRQAGDRLRSRFGRLNVGLVAPGEELDLSARVQVATVQTLLARGVDVPASLVVFDEAHHYVANDWNKLVQRYPEARSLGITATPERRDGKPLGDMFDALVVAAQYSELLRDGHIVPCRAYQPPQRISDGLALDPLDAYHRYAEQSQAFVFCQTVRGAYDLAERFREAGITAAVVEAKTPKGTRDDLLDRFSRGDIRVLLNVYALTEGVDIPSARTVILARACDHVQMFLQICGRVLRPHSSKRDAILIDLTGATIKHGMPTEDREYALTGEGIRRSNAMPLRNCLQCGATLPAVQRRCPECGYEAPAQAPKPPRIYDYELRQVYAGKDTPDEAKQSEFERLRLVAVERGFSLSWAVREYERLFSERPELGEVTHDERKLEFARLQELQRERGYKPGFVGARYKELFGHYPPREWSVFGVEVA